MKKLLALFFTTFVSILTYSQDNACHLRVSLLTCGAGDELYTAWGHSALRVTDSSSYTDLIFNYGSFDFDAPGFYTKFAEGNMMYFVSVEKFTDFVAEYRYFNRSIIEQELNLSCTEKQRLYQALKENAKEQNKYYRYDFLFDNCSSRLRDIVSKNTIQPPVIKNIIPGKQVSFWNMIHENLDKYHESWNRLGIDILLGSHMDAIATNHQTMFLPDYLMKGFDSAEVDNHPLVINKKLILATTGKENKSDGITPFITFSILLLVVGICSFNKKINHSVFFTVFDFVLFLLVGLLGILLLFLWFGRVDSICSNNFNILWAVPTHAAVAFVIGKKWKLLGVYWLLNSILLILLLLAWHWLPQEMNNGLLPLVILLILRSAIRYNRVKLNH